MATSKLISWRDVPVTNRAGSVTGAARIELLRSYRDSGVMGEAWPVDQDGFDGPWDDDGPRAAMPAPDAIDWSGLDPADAPLGYRIYAVADLEDATFYEAHDRSNGGWFFEPTDYEGGSGPFSVGYPTREAALYAAHRWAQEHGEG